MLTIDFFLFIKLVCGSKVFDFAELEAATEYDGYTVDSAAVRNFWRVAHALPPESQRRLLQFTTGSDRVPVGGLSRLKMVISRHGPDSDRYYTRLIFYGGHWSDKFYTSSKC